MLTSNLWVEMGLVNGAMGTVIGICYHDGESPPNLPKYGLTLTVVPDCQTELFPSLHFAAPGLHLVVLVHVYNSLSAITIHHP